MTYHEFDGAQALSTLQQVSQGCLSDLALHEPPGLLRLPTIKVNG